MPFSYLQHATPYLFVCSLCLAFALAPTTLSTSTTEISGMQMGSSVRGGTVRVQPCAGWGRSVGPAAGRARCPIHAPCCPPCDPCMRSNSQTLAQGTFCRKRRHMWLQNDNGLGKTILGGEEAQTRRSCTNWRGSKRTAGWSPYLSPRRALKRLVEDAAPATQEQLHACMGKQMQGQKCPPLAGISWEQRSSND